MRNETHLLKPFDGQNREAKSMTNNNINYDDYANGQFIRSETELFCKRQTAS